MDPSVGVSEVTSETPLSEVNKVPVGSRSRVADSWGTRIRRCDTLTYSSRLGRVDREISDKLTLSRTGNRQVGHKLQARITTSFPTLSKESPESDKLVASFQQGSPLRFGRRRRSYLPLATSTPGSPFDHPQLAALTMESTT